MGKIYMFNFVTLDGYFEGARKWDLEWHKVDKEFQQFAIDQLNATDTLIFGRITYEGMANYWTSPDAEKDDPVVASKMNAIRKIVFSRTMNQASWNNTRLVTGSAFEELSKLKAQTGKDVGIFGSANLVSGFIRENLIDEFRIMVNPVILGRGGELFKGIEKMVNLKLAGARVFKSGNVLLSYERGD